MLAKSCHKGNHANESTLTVFLAKSKTCGTDATAFEQMLHESDRVLGQILRWLYVDGGNADTRTRTRIRMSLGRW